MKRINKKSRFPYMGMGRCTHIAKRTGRRCKIKLNLGWCHVHSRIEEKKEKKKQRDRDLDIAYDGFMNLVNVYEWANKIEVDEEDIDHLFFNAWMLGEEAKEWKLEYGEEFMDEVIRYAYDACI